MRCFFVKNVRVIVCTRTRTFNRAVKSSTCNIYSQFREPPMNVARCKRMPHTQSCETLLRTVYVVHTYRICIILYALCQLQSSYNVQNRCVCVYVGVSVCLCLYVVFVWWPLRRNENYPTLVRARAHRSRVYVCVCLCMSITYCILYACKCVVCHVQHLIKHTQTRSKWRASAQMHLAYAHMMCALCVAVYSIF